MSSNVSDWRDGVLRAEQAAPSRTRMASALQNLELPFAVSRPVKNGSPLACHGWNQGAPSDSFRGRSIEAITRENMTTDEPSRPIRPSR